MTQRSLITEPGQDQTGWLIGINSLYKPWLAASTGDDDRPALTGVYIDPEGYAVAVDGFMAAILPCTIEAGALQSGTFEGCLIPAQFVKAAHKLNKKNPL